MQGQIRRKMQGWLQRKKWSSWLRSASRSTVWEDPYDQIPFHAWAHDEVDDERVLAPELPTFVLLSFKAFFRGSSALSASS